MKIAAYIKLDSAQGEIIDEEAGQDVRVLVVAVNAPGFKGDVRVYTRDGAHEYDVPVAIASLGQDAEDDLFIAIDELI